MKDKFGNFFRAFLALLLLVLFWSVWTSVAQTTASNTVAVAVPATATGQTNQVARVLVTNPAQDESDITPDWVIRLSEDFPSLQYMWWGNQLWKYITTLIYIILALCLSWFLDYLTRVLVRRWAKKADAEVRQLFLDLLEGPVRMVVFVILLHIGFDVLRWPAKVQVILNKGFILVVAVTVTFMLLKFIDLAMAYWRRTAPSDADSILDAQLFPFFRKSFKVFIIVVAALVTADNMGVHVTAVLTSLSIGGLAVGLAAQDTLSNFFGAIAVFFDKPFRIGDTIRVDSVEGTVESIGMRSTRVRTDKGFLVTIPNKTVGNATITNLSRRFNIQAEMNIRLRAETSVEQTRRALAILEEIFRGEPKILNPVVNFNKFGDSSLNILVTYAWKGLDDAAHQAAIQQFNLLIKQRLETEGINLALPSQMVYLKQDSAAREQSELKTPPAPPKPA